MKEGQEERMFWETYKKKFLEHEREWLSECLGNLFPKEDIARPKMPLSSKEREMERLKDKLKNTKISWE